MTSESTRILGNYLVAELAEGVAGQYIGKLLADAGAQVVKIEPPQGNALRAWSAAKVPGAKRHDTSSVSSDGVADNAPSHSSDDSSGSQSHDTSGAFFQYLNSSKGSIVANSISDPTAAKLLSAADIIIEDHISKADLSALLASRPDAVVTSISPYGRNSPEADLPATEFTLQARAGGIGKRGRLENPPVQAGGRIGEWMAGISGAVGTLAAAQRAESTGQGEHVDVSMFEGLVIATNIYSFLYASLLGNWDLPRPYRTLEMPSIEPTADGFVGFCTMAQQQFQDFLVMVGAPEWVKDPTISSPFERWARRDEFFERVHAWTKPHTTAEIIQIASSLRIPVALIGNGAIVPDLEVFEGRDMFFANPGGGFTQPRRPYQIHGVNLPEFTPAPHLGATTADDLNRMLAEHQKAPRETAASATSPPATQTPAAPATQTTAASATQTSPPLPLEGIRIVECTGWWAGPIAGQTLAMLGADIIKVESIQRPDGMRFASVKPASEDQWWEWGMVYQGVNTNKRGITLNLTDPEGKAVLEKLLGSADVLIENYTPRVMDNFGLTWETVSKINPQLIMVRMPGFGLSGPWRDNTGFAQTMEQMSGLAYITGYPEEPPQIPRGPGDPIAGIHASFAILLALEERKRSHQGRLVEVAMIEAAVNVAAEPVVEYSATNILMERLGNFTPGLAPQGVFECQQDETWVAISAATDEQWQALARIIGRADLAEDPDLATWEGRWQQQQELCQAITVWTRSQEVGAAAQQLLAAGVPAYEVKTDRIVGHDQLLWDRGFFVSVDHPIANSHGYPSLAFRYANNPDPWVNRPPPTIGEHNKEVLQELGLTESEIAHLSDTKVIGDRPLFA